MARELVDIILRIMKEGTGGRDVADELKGIDKATKKAEDGFKGLQKSWKKFAAAGASVAGALYTLKKAYDFGKEGAAILQTRDSFDRLMASMGAGPDVLQRLQAASRGTVDDMTLMSSTMTLLAGTSETMGRAIVDASPRLMEIAKAANKLNPALGTTAQMYNSIATGVKRAQPLILDNLGLTIKVGDANEKYAASIGKTVEQLTAEEKTMAILAATLEAGDRMIAQVGGSTEAMGDSMAAAEANLKNVTDELKTRLVPATTAAAEEFTRFLIVAGGQLPAELAKTIAAAEGTGKSFKQLAEEAREAKAMMIYGGPEQKEAKLFWIDMTDKVKLTAEEFVKLGDASGATWKEMQALAADMGIKLAWEDYAAAMGIMERNTEGTTLALGGLHTQMSHFATATPHLESLEGAMVGIGAAVGPLTADTEVWAQVMADRAIVAADNFKASLDTLHFAIRGEFGDALDEYQSELAELEGSLESGTITQDEYATSVEKATSAFKENTNAIIFNIAEKQILDALEKGLIEDVNASGTAYDEATTALWRLAEQTGLVDAATLELMGAVQAETSAFIAGKSTTDAWVGGLGNLYNQMGNVSSGADGVTASLGRIPNYKQIVIETYYKTTGTPPHGGAGPEPPPQYYQHGGQFIVRGPSGPDRVPVNFRATAGEVVTVTPVGGTPPADPTVTNNWNLTLNSSQSSQGVIRDFNIMQAMVG